MHYVKLFDITDFRAFFLGFAINSIKFMTFDAPSNYFLIFRYFFFPHSMWSKFSFPFTSHLILVSLFYKTIHFDVTNSFNFNTILT